MKLYSWGANNYGQLGLGYICEQCNYPSLVPGSELINDNIKCITGGGAHTLLLDSSGSVYGSGLNSSHQLGLSHCDKVSEIKRITYLEKYKVSQITCGWDSSFAITYDGLAFVWGSNMYGQLGISNDQIKKVEEPVQLAINGVVQISSGLRHTAILMENGKVFVSGQGRKGQLGLIRDGQPLAQSDLFLEVPYLENVKMIACGQNHTLALTKDGNLFAWGDNKHGQLGCDPTLCEKAYTPMLVKSEVDAHNIISVQAGWTHSVFHTDDGFIMNCGRNSYGQLGSLLEKRSVTWNPQCIDFNKHIKQLAVGSEHNFIISDDGEVWSWGWNEHGNCGLGNDSNVLVPTKIQLQNKANLIGTGSAHSFTVTE